jgi:hypothetical protein
LRILNNFLNDILRRSSAMPRSLDQRISAVTTPMAAPALSLDIQHSGGSQVVSDDVLGKVGSLQL